MESIKISTELHVGVELGGTTCKAALFRREISGEVSRFVQVGFQEFQTSHEDPMFTFDEIKTWTLFTLQELDPSHEAVLPATLGIAAFGPICLDRSSDQYGCITTTPKLAWQNFPVYSLFK